MATRRVCRQFACTVHERCTLCPAVLSGLVAALQIALQGVDNASVRTRMLLGRSPQCTLVTVSPWG